jgi:hypothetical protein
MKIVPLPLRSFAVTALAAVLLIIPTRILAVTIVDTGPGDNNFANGFNTSSSLATEFNMANAMTLTSVEGWLGSLYGTISVSIYSDGGSTPGSVLHTGLFAAPAFTATQSWQGVYGLNWSLGAGSYWVVFGAISGGGSLGGHSASPLGLEAYSFPSQFNPGQTVWQGFDNGADYGVRILGRVPGNAVPDGGHTALLLGGALFVCGLIRSRRT